MNEREIFDGLWKITKEKYDVCKSEAENMNKDHPTERSALQLRAGIYNVAIAAGLISGSDNAISLMRSRFKNLIKYFPVLSHYYDGLSDNEKNIMEIALYPEIFMSLNFYNTYKTDLVQAQKEGCPEAIFKAEIKKETLKEILSMWRKFRVENELFSFAFDEKEVCD